ncbi:MAG: exodeoxyribonuclease VII large subunit [Oscillospiraceae bacterium]|nr:exodeoxyribonuclease VII large subunit [Oscillospiraceae bacterium]
MTDTAPVSVSELTAHIRDIIDLDPLLKRVLVRGELSNYKVYSSGHRYFTLKDSEAALSCVMFRSDAERVRFRPENGMSVLCSGQVSVYARDGKYQLYVRQMQPDGVGDLYVAFEQLKARLQSEGLFASEHKKPIPVMPSRIAVVTSASGAAVRDIIRVLGKRWPLSKVIVLPVRVQGEEASREIAAAIRYANRWKVADLIIAGRGGGSMEDLWAFNEEVTARAIYDSEIPVISAVGHEPDFTIADFTADRRAATPSNAAELAVPEREKVLESLAVTQLRADRAVRRILDSGARRLESLSSRPIMESPMAFIDQRRLDVDRFAERMDAAERHVLSENRQKYIRLVSALEALSPLRVLARGYSVVTLPDGTVVRRSEQAAPGSLLRVRLSEGALNCRVENRTEESS